MQKIAIALLGATLLLSATSSVASDGGASALAPVLPKGYAEFDAISVECAPITLTLKVGRQKIGRGDDAVLGVVQVLEFALNAPVAYAVTTEAGGHENGELHTYYEDRWHTMPISRTTDESQLLSKVELALFESGGDEALDSLPLCFAELALSLLPSVLKEAERVMRDMGDSLHTP